MSMVSEGGAHNSTERHLQEVTIGELPRHDAPDVLSEYSADGPPRHQREARRVRSAAGNRVCCCRSISGPRRSTGTPPTLVVWHRTAHSSAALLQSARSGKSPWPKHESARDTHSRAQATSSATLSAALSGSTPAGMGAETPQFVVRRRSPPPLLLIDVPCATGNPSRRRVSAG